MSDWNGMDVIPERCRDPEPDPRLDRLEVTVAQQTAALAIMTDQLRALFIVNTALMATLRSQTDIDLVRAIALDAFADEARDGNAVLHVNAMFGEAKPGEPLSKEAMRNRLREIARSRFTVINGGRPDEEAE